MNGEQSFDDERVFRVSSRNRVAAKVMTVVLFVMCVSGGTWSAIEHFRAPDSMPAIIVIAWFTVFGFMSIVGVCWVLWNQAHRLTVRAESFESTSRFGRRTVAFGDVVRVKWCNAWKVLLHGRDGKFPVELWSYSQDERDQLVAFIRERFSTLPQVGWDRFVVHYERVREEDVFDQI